MRRFGQQSTVRAGLVAALVLVFILSLTVLMHAALGQNRLGADFYIFWKAGRALFFENRSPYSSEVMLQTQQDILGRNAGPLEDNLAFVYPLYSLFGILPNIALPYEWALPLWYSTNLVILLSLVYLLFPEGRKAASVTVLLFYPILFGLLMGNFAIPVGIAILFFYGMVVMRKNHSLPVQAAAGVLLAWGTLKPQFIWCLCAFALLYAARNRLYPFLVAFFAGLAALLAVSWVMLPGWVSGWLHFVGAYASYQQIAPSVVEVLRPFMSMRAADITGWAILLAFLGFGIYLALRWWRGELHWLAFAAWAGIFTYMLHPHGLSYEQIPSLIPLLLWAAKDGLRSAEKMFFYTVAVAISWVPLLFTGTAAAVDRAPFLWLVVWFAWLLSRNGKQSQRRSTAYTV